MKLRFRSPVGSAGSFRSRMTKSGIRMTHARSARRSQKIFRLTKSKRAQLAAGPDQVCLPCPFSPSCSSMVASPASILRCRHFSPTPS
ncbi:unnamed protein product [Protopolystoma xenopodis]|uniref:Uncharacterized protein n=1 Tax=Protopolystoma xenopodis TaxID=117903 RepID=A0A448WMK1_9PLAT|nr:unnamed protein product [Protopolystoma xenopodis]